MIPLSVLDLVPVRAGSPPRTRSRNLWSWPARRAAGLSRATGSPSITAWRASPARRPEILIEHVASATTTHPRRFRRHHAAEPHAAARGGGVPHARGAASGPHRPRHRPRAGHRSGHLARAASLRRVEQFPSRCRSCCALSRRAFPPEHPFASVRVVPADVRAAADLGAGVERRDGRVCRLDGPGLRLCATLQPRRRRARRSARIAQHSSRRRSSRRRTSSSACR